MRLELFDVRRRWPRQRTQRDDERGFVNSGILFSLSSSVQFVGLILPSNSHAEIKTRLYASAIFPISGDWDVLLPLIWNGLCDRRRVEITIMQFIGQSLPPHHFFYVTVRIFTLSHIVSQAVFYTITLSQSGPGSNGNEGVVTLPRSQELDFYHQMLFSVIPMTPFIFRAGV